MIERITDYSGYLIHFKGSAASQRPILLLHGFPAHRSVKNLDLAFLLHQKLNRDVFLLHYRGLGDSPGVFRFTKSIEEGIEVVDRLTSLMGYDAVDLVGHSWGGLVATNIAIQRPQLVKSLVLVSPFVQGNKTEPLYQWFVHGVRSELPQVYRDLSEQEVISEIDTILENHLPMNLVAQLSPSIKVTIIQAAYDVTTLASHARQLVTRFATPPKYVELAQDHSFTQDRNGLANEIISALK